MLLIGQSKDWTSKQNAGCKKRTILLGASCKVQDARSRPCADCNKLYVALKKIEALGYLSFLLRNLYDEATARMKCEATTVGEMQERVYTVIYCPL